MNTLTVAPPNPHRVSLGIGYNFFDHLGAGGTYNRYADYPLHEVVHPDPAIERDWSRFIEALDDLRPSFIRYGFPPDQHVDAQGKLISDSLQWRRLIAFDAWARNNNCTLQLDPFLIPRHYEFAPPEGTQDPGPRHVNMSARDNRAYARNFVAPLLAHVVHTLKLDSVQWFNPVNEPLMYGVYQTPKNSPEVHAHFVEMYQEMRGALNDADIPRSRIKLMGPDASFEKLLEIEGRGLDLDSTIDAYCDHYYNPRFDYLLPANGSWTSPIQDCIDRHTRLYVKYANLRHKPFFATELGTFYYGWRENNPAGAASFDAMLTIAEATLRAVNVGVECVAYWSLMNPDNIDGHWSTFAIENAQLIKKEPRYSITRTLCRHLRPGAQIHPIRANTPLSHVHGTLAKNPDGSLAILLINDHPVENQSIQLELPDFAHNRNWNAQLIDRVRQNVAFIGFSESNNVLTARLPAFSLLTLSV